MNIDERIERLTERHEALAESVALLLDSQRKTEETLRRAIRLGVREARIERKRRQEVDLRVQKMDARFDEKMREIASAQRINEEELAKLNASVQRFIESLQRGGNGHQAS
ncbi:MAG: hypothetical protein LAQ69_34270 [Acidobacteriia bacterium]|nr:hypothetical protein [Terriglobia bacterium]